MSVFRYSFFDSVKTTGKDSNSGPLIRSHFKDELHAVCAHPTRQVWITSSQHFPPHNKRCVTFISSIMWLMTCYTVSHPLFSWHFSSFLHIFYFFSVMNFSYCGQLYHFYRIKFLRWSCFEKTFVHKSLFFNIYHRNALQLEMIKQFVFGT